MTNKELKEVKKQELLKLYKRNAFTDNYIFGYFKNGVVYAALLNHCSHLLDFLTFAEDAKDERGFKLKYRPNKSQIELIESHASDIKAITTLTDLELNYKKVVNNRGLYFEYLAIQAFNAKKTRNNTTFIAGGDCIIDNIHYQIKYNRASLLSELTAKNLKLRAE